MKITSQHKMYDPVYEVYDQGNNLTTFYLEPRTVLKLGSRDYIHSLRTI